jgi:hypothetical protein
MLTRPYHDLYSFDSRKLKCDGLIKGMVVTLDQLPAKRVMMDIVVVDVPTNYGMLLSRTWSGKVGGTIHMDMAYATLPVFGGENIRLYQKTQFSYVVSDKNNPRNHPIYATNEYLGYCILLVNKEYSESPIPTYSPLRSATKVDGV